MRCRAQQIAMLLDALKLTLMAAARRKTTARPRVELPPPDPERLAAATKLAERAHEPAVVENIRFGTAGWTDRTLVQGGLFYPPGASSPQARLEHYAKHFAFVEVDATYYALLPPETTARWVEWTPANFCFDVKAHPVLTGHPIDMAKLPSDLKQELERAGICQARLSRADAAGDPRTDRGALRRAARAFDPGEQARCRAFAVSALVHRDARQLAASRAAQAAFCRCQAGDRVPPPELVISGAP